MVSTVPGSPILSFFLIGSKMQLYIFIYMKYILSLLLLITVTSYSQDTVTLVHKAYKTTYSKSKHYPIKVEWWATRANLTCVVKAKRGDKII